ncbi:MAG: hypothetical protein Kow006_09570 [Gammaproteobacteria bacterium]
MFSRLSLLAVGILLAGPIVWLGVDAQGSRQHLAGEVCDTCHLSADVTAENAHQLRASEERLCTGCHPAALEMSHPSGFAPDRELPEVFPLDWKGDLTCSTCHRIHGEVTALGRTQLSGKSLCLSCHDDAFFRRMRDGGVSLIRSGHLDTRANLPGGLLDNYSIQCLGCHEDELSSQGLQVTVSPTGIARHGSGSANHPVGTDYATAAGFGGYRERGAIPPAILLPGGKVSCISCHEGYTSDHGKTLVTTRGLCLECHDM